MTWRAGLAAALVVGAALVCTACGRKPDDTSEPKQTRPTGGSETPTRPDKTNTGLKFTTDKKVTPETKGSPGATDKKVTPETKVSAEELARAFKTDQQAAVKAYVGKTFLVTGKLKDVKVVGDGTHVVFEDQQGPGGPQMAYAMKGYLKLSPFNYSRGQGLTLQVRCVGTTAEVVSFADCAVTGYDPEPTPKLTASDLIAAYRTDADGDAKYKGKLLRVENAEVEKLPQDGTLIMVPFGRIPGSKPPAKKIRVEYDPSYKPLFKHLKEGGLNMVYGRCEGVSGGEIVIKDAWFLPY